MKDTRSISGLGSAWTRPALPRFLIVGGLALVMLVPLGLLNGLVKERADLRRQAVDGIVEPWGGRQTIAGPVLVVPVQQEELSKSYVEVEGQQPVERVTRHVTADSLIILPKDLKVDASLDHQERERGIYKAVVYGAAVRMDATFDMEEGRRFVADRDGMTADWARAKLALGISGLRSLRDIEPPEWNGEAVRFRPGSTVESVLGSGLHGAAPVPRDKDPISVSLSFRLNGSERLAVVPVGEQSLISLASSWPHPSFKGAGLPDRSTVTADGFTAAWSIPSLARDFPQVGLGSEWDGKVTSVWVGASLFEPVSLYWSIERAAKYGILFVSLTFALFLALEFRSGDSRIHPVQYLLVGLSMATFYLVLLALAEHIPFLAAYAAAAAISAGMVGAYLASVLGSLRRGVGVVVGQGVLYGALFIVLRLEDLALLVGSALVLIVLGLLMAATRRLSPPGDGDDAPDADPEPSAAGTVAS